MDDLVGQVDNHDVVCIIGQLRTMTKRKHEIKLHEAMK